MTSDSDGSPTDPRHAESRTRPGRSDARDMDAFAPGSADIYSELLFKVLAQDSRDARIRVTLLYIGSLILIALPVGIVVFLASREFFSSAWILLGAVIVTTFRIVIVMIQNYYRGDR